MADELAPLSTRLAPLIQRHAALGAERQLLLEQQARALATIDAMLARLRTLEQPS